MIFDRFARLAEKHLPQKVTDTLEKAKLFSFPYIAHEVLPHTYTEEEYLFLRDNFFLPFPVVAVEDPGGVIVLEDTEENARGTKVTRMFAECMPMDADMSAFADGHKVDPNKDYPLAGKGAYALNFGWFKYESVGARTWEGHGVLEATVVANTEEIFGVLGPRDMGDAIKAVLKNVGTAIQEVMYLNCPDKFLLEKQPVGKPRRKGRDKKPISRSHERQVFTLLSPHAIREEMGVQDLLSEKRRQGAHERRAHVRTLRSKRYKEARGKRIVIPATWVGLSEAVAKGKRYKVRLDM